MTRVWCTERRVRRVVLRVPGIYGPGRLPVERLRRREPMLHPDEAGISNRIHVADLVEACVAAVVNAEARGVYNITDGNSCSSTHFLDRLAALTNVAPAPRVSMDEAQLTFSQERLSFLHESRRVSNERMLKHLGVTPRYADIDEGIRQSLEEEALGPGLWEAVGCSQNQSPCNPDLQYRPWPAEKVAFVMADSSCFPATA